MKPDESRTCTASYTATYTATCTEAAPNKPNIECNCQTAAANGRQENTSRATGSKVQL